MSNSISIDGLTPGNVYEFSIRAHISENDYGPYSGPVQRGSSNQVEEGRKNIEDYFRNEVLQRRYSAVQPVAPENLGYELVDASTIQLKWSDKEGSFIKYDIIYSRDNNLPLENWNKEEVNGLRHPYKVCSFSSWG